jgi:hypothetical protein
MTTTRGRGRTLARTARKPPVTIKVKIDPKRRARYQKLLDELTHAKRDEASGFDHYWEAVGEILDGELYVDGGYDTADAFIAAEIKEPRRTALRNVRVAKYASPIEEATYGNAIIDAAISFIEAKTGGPVEGALPIKLEALRIPVETKGHTQRLALKDATLQQITAATRALTRRKGTERPHPSPSHAAIVQAFQGVKSLASITVHVSNGMLRLGAIPLWAVDDLARTLRGLKLPADAKSSARRK